MTVTSSGVCMNPLLRLFQRLSRSFSDFVLILCPSRREGGQFSCRRGVSFGCRLTCEGALYRTFPPEEARRILNRLQFHFTPKHASWLNMVEIEIGVLVRQCLDRRIADVDALAREVAAWSKLRNQEKATIEWLLRVAHAREKLCRHYPDWQATNEAA